MGYEVEESQAEQIDLLECEVAVLKREVELWKRNAAYLASCHAATLESLPKSASKSMRSRLKGLCELSVKMFKGELSRRSVTVESATERCRLAAEEV